MNADLDTRGSSSSSSIRLMPGERLTLTLESPPDSNPSIVWKGPGSKTHNGDKSLSLSQLGWQESGTWECSVSYGKKTLVLNINILVPGKRGPSPLQTPPADCPLPPWLTDRASALTALLLVVRGRGRLGRGCPQGLGKHWALSSLG